MWGLAGELESHRGSCGGGRGGRDTGQGRAMAMATLGHNRVCGSILKCSVQVCVYFYNFMLSPVTTPSVAEKLGGLGRNCGPGGWVNSVEKPRRGLFFNSFVFYSLISLSYVRESES